MELIDERGIHLSTVTSDQGFVPHERVKAVQWQAGAIPPDLDQAKRERLLTIPRLQKPAPPSHLLCSHNGDFLRCRVIRVDQHVATVEVQLEEVQVPRERIAQIIWFHSDELPRGSSSARAGESDASEDNADPRDGTFAGQVQVLKRDGRRVTFAPSDVDGKSIGGVSDIIGECRFALNDVDQLIFGSRIAEEVSEIGYNQWKLKPAVEPLVTQASSGPSPAGSQSPLIGKPAPEVALDLLDGGEFRLSEHRGKIVVLDFWASWCAPCTLSMPKVEATLANYDPDQVLLLSVNLEEPADHIRSVMERQNLNSRVALDVDGVTALRYQATAIPQMVIVDTEGNISRLYVGGGDSMVEQMESAIVELLGESR